MRRFSTFCIVSVVCGVVCFPLRIFADTLRLPKGPIEGQAVIDLPAPTQVQSVTLKNSVAISWEWKTPEVMPDRVSFGFEVRRQDGKLFVTAGHAMTDTDVGIGSYTYVVRVRAESKSKKHGQRTLSHISDWSDQVEANFNRTCTDSPQITLDVAPTQKEYASVPSLRMHITGYAVVPEGCHLLKSTYHIDSGTGILHSGPIETNAQGRIDLVANAIEPDDEIPTGTVSFGVSVTSEDENGPATSSVTMIDVELKNPFAPKS